jgi:hypothetical protein
MLGQSDARLRHAALPANSTAGRTEKSTAQARHNP